MTISLIGTLAIAATIVTPAYLTASPRDGLELIAARHRQHQRIIELLGSLISSSRQVLAVHQRGATPYLQVVLWLEDKDNFGEVDPDEIALISHSRLLQTITLHSRDREAADDASTEGEPALDASSDNYSPSFCAAWRARADVLQRLLATGIESMTIEPVAAASASRPMLRISLTWAADSADGPDKASALLDVVMRPGGDAGRSD